MGVSQVWRRPFKDTHAAPHDIWIMAAPVTTSAQHLWIDSGNVYGLDLYVASCVTHASDLLSLSL